MRSATRRRAAVLLGALLGLPAAAPAQVQPPPGVGAAPAAPQARPVAPQAPPAAGVAATVNGQPIAEVSVQRGLKRVPPERHAEARPEILNYLIDNLLLEQDLVQRGVAVEKKEVEDKITEMLAELKKQGMEFDKLLKDMSLTEEELRGHILADLRWDKFALAQATDKALGELFEGNRELFDGSMVRARHVLLTPPSGDPQACEQARAQLVQIKQQVEKQVADGLAKLPPSTDNLAREQARVKLIDEAFAALAREKSACPSKAQGGDVDWFRRAGYMVEPFAKVAFALKPYQLSDVVQTQYGFHLILPTDRRPGKDVKFEDVKDEVKEVFADRLREALCAQLRQKAKIAVTPPAR